MHIDVYNYGNFIIDGRRYTSDIKIMRKQVIFWEAEYNNMTLDNVRDIVMSSPEVIIIGTGFSGMLKVPPVVREYIEKRNVELIIEKTQEACRLYNELSNIKEVAAIIHIKG